MGYSRVNPFLIVFLILRPSLHNEFRTAPTVADSDRHGHAKSRLHLILTNAFTSTELQKDNPDTTVGGNSAEHHAAPRDLGLGRDRMLLSRSSSATTAGCRRTATSS